MVQVHLQQDQDEESADTSHPLLGDDASLCHCLYTPRVSVAMNTFPLNTSSNHHKSIAK